MNKLITYFIFFLFINSVIAITAVSGTNFILDDLSNVNGNIKIYDKQSTFNKYVINGCSLSDNIWYCENVHNNFLINISLPNNRIGKLNLIVVYNISGTGTSLERTRSYEGIEVIKNNQSFFYWPNNISFSLVVSIFIFIVIFVLIVCIILVKLYIGRIKNNNKEEDGDDFLEQVRNIIK